MEKQDEVENSGTAIVKELLPHRDARRRWADEAVEAAFPEVMFKGPDGRKLIIMGKWALNFRERYSVARGGLRFIWRSAKDSNGEVTERRCGGECLGSRLVRWIRMGRKQKDLNSRGSKESLFLRGVDGVLG